MAETTSSSGSGAAIHVQNLGKTFGSVQALKSLNFTVPRGTICGFLGPNGAGKTTAIKVLLGLSQPTSGRATVLGYHATRESLAVRRRVGYLDQDPSFYRDMTARQILRFIAGFYELGTPQEVERRIDEMLALVDLEERADRAVGGFSGGERQRLGIAQAQLSKPELLILDEPAAALDPMGRQRVLNIMQELRDTTTIFYSTHILDDVQRVSDTVVILKDGEVVSQGPIKNLLHGGADLYRLVLRMVDDQDRLADLRQTVLAQPWAEAVESEPLEDRFSWQVIVNDRQAADHHLLRMVVNHPGLVVEDFGRPQRNLEQAFMAMMEDGGENV